MQSGTLLHIALLRKTSKNKNRTYIFNPQHHQHHQNPTYIPLAFPHNIHHIHHNHHSHHSHHHSSYPNSQHQHQQLQHQQLQLHQQLHQQTEHEHEQRSIIELCGRKWSQGVGYLRGRERGRDRGTEENFQISGWSVEENQFCGEFGMGKTKKLGQFRQSHSQQRSPYFPQQRSNIYTSQCESRQPQHDSSKDNPYKLKQSDLNLKLKQVKFNSHACMRTAIKFHRISLVYPKENQDEGKGRQELEKGRVKQKQYSNQKEKKKEKEKENQGFSEIWGSLRKNGDNRIKIRARQEDRLKNQDEEFLPISNFANNVRLRKFFKS